MAAIYSLQRCCKSVFLGGNYGYRYYRSTNIQCWIKPLKLSTERYGALIKQYVPETNYSILEGNVDERNYKVSFEKIAKELNFSPDYTLESGIQEMIKEIQVNSALQNYKNNIYSNLETLKLTQGNA